MVGDSLKVFVCVCVWVNECVFVCMCAVVWGVQQSLPTENIFQFDTEWFKNSLFHEVMASIVQLNRTYFRNIHFYYLLFQMKVQSYNLFDVRPSLNNQRRSYEVIKARWRSHGLWLYVPQDQNIQLFHYEEQNMWQHKSQVLNVVYKILQDLFSFALVQGSKMSV